MSFFQDPPLHDFPDRAIRLLQAHPEHLRELVEDVAPALAPHLDFSQARPLDRTFPLPDWRRRESDLLFHVPFRPGEPVEEALVCVLVEHQSAHDAAMPLRTLWYAVLYWEREWRRWSDRHERGTPLRLNPVLPVVLHTGSEPWATARGLRELMAGPVSLHAYVPDWQPLFWDLAERTPEALLKQVGYWLPALAAVRAEHEDADRFHAVLAETLHRLEPLHDKDPNRWGDLLWFLLSWGLRRRPRPEQEQLYATVLASHDQVSVRQEVEQMSKVAWINAEQEWLAMGRLDQARAMLLRQGTRRFGPPAPAAAAMLAGIADLARLERMGDHVLEASDWDALLSTP